jgi:hypothetical protein
MKEKKRRSKQLEVEKNVLRDLGNGLILRKATRADTENLVAFNGMVHAEESSEEPDEKVAVWTRDLLEKPHPTFSPADFTIVEESNTGKIVSSLNLISQTWSYSGIPFGVGRPELVGTLNEYRGRGLVRAQMEEIHRWSAERGHMLHAITGIPYYYRLFGYEMALELGAGRVGYKPNVPKLKKDEVELHRLRPASVEDIPFISQTYSTASKRWLVSAIWDEELWRYELLGKSDKNVNRRELRIIEASDSEPVGFLSHPTSIWGTTFGAGGYELKPGISWFEVTPSIIRYLWETGEEYARRDKVDDFGAFAFWLGSEHPAYQAVSQRLPHTRRPYAWFMRVEDIPAFLIHVIPVLNARLAESVMTNFSGDLRISFYINGLRFKFEKGQLKIVEPWKPSPNGHSGEAGFPGLTFLQLLFGFRSVEELEFAFPDCWIDDDEPRELIKALFPKGVSDVWGIT